jgi:hypothetical protein
VKNELNGGVVAAVLAVVILALIGLWTFRDQKEKAAAADRRAIILRGAGGEHPPTR